MYSMLLLLVYLVSAWAEQEPSRLVALGCEERIYDAVLAVSTVRYTSTNNPKRWCRPVGESRRRADSQPIRRLNNGPDKINRYTIWWL